LAAGEKKRERRRKGEREEFFFSSPLGSENGRNALFSFLFSPSFSFLMIPSEGRPHGWIQPNRYGKQTLPLPFFWKTGGASFSPHLSPP